MSYTSPSLAQFDQRYVDIDFGIESEDTGNLCGCLPDPSDLMLSIPDFEEREEIIPREKWPDLIAGIDESDGWLERMIRKIKAQSREGSCFPAGTLIRMADGTQKPIERVSVVDQVLTAEGNIGTVVKTSARKANRLFHIKMRGHSSLMATAEHPILTKRGYVGVTELVEGDLVKIPRYCAANIEPEIHWISTADYIDTRRHTARKGGKISFHIPGKPIAVATRTEIPDIIHLTPGFGRIIGLFLAEGSTSHQKVTWTFGLHEEHTLVEELVQLLSDECGAVAKVRRRKNAMQVEVFGVQWSRMFVELCATGAGNKKLHNIFSTSPLDFQKEILFGWLDGDGHRLKSGRTSMTGVTISKELAFAMFDIANAIGRRPSIRFQIAKPNRWVKSRRTAWLLRLNEEDNCPKGYKAPLDDGAMWRPVTSVDPVEFDGYVYNLEVEGDHSYVADGIGVHNCVYNMAAQMLEIAWNTQFGIENWIELSPISGYRWNASGPRTGSNVGGSLDWLIEHGLLPVNSDANQEKVKAGLFQHTHPATGYYEKFQDGWQSTAKLFRVHEWVRLTSVEAWFSALLKGFPCGGGRDWHAICHCRPLQDGNRFLSLYANSWGKWGATYNTANGPEKGFGIDTESKVRAMVSRGAYAIRSVLVPPWLAK